MATVCCVRGSSFLCDPPLRRSSGGQTVSTHFCPVICVASVFVSTGCSWSLAWGRTRNCSFCAANLISGQLQYLCEELAEQDPLWASVRRSFSCMLERCLKGPRRHVSGRFWGHSPPQFVAAKPRHVFEATNDIEKVRYRVRWVFFNTCDFPCRSSVGIMCVHNDLQPPRHRANFHAIRALATWQHILA